MNKICLLGSTGSIGTQTLDVAKHLGLSVTGLSARNNIDLLEKQLYETGAKMCAVEDEQRGIELKKRLSGKGIQVYIGKAAASTLCSKCECDTVVNAIIGFSGLEPTLCAIDNKKNVAIANKETLVSAGEIVMKRARQMGVQILPIDSEHCAIHQCLRSCKKGEVKRLIITGSGGPFFGYTKEQLKNVTKEQALCHPNWSMGKGITVYSSTLVNKGLEMIEAMRLFDMDMENIDVIIHRESIIHSMVEMTDGSIIAQMGVPDMRHCIQYALTYPERISGLSAPLNLASVGKLTFFEPDNEVFPSINLARRAVKYGGVSTAVYNASNEMCVDMFLEDKIGYTDIFSIMDKCVESVRSTGETTLSDIIDADKKAREFSKNLAK